MKKVVVITPYVPPNIVNLYKILLKKISKDNIQLKIFCVKKIPIHRKHEIPDYSDLDINFFDGLNFYLPKSEIAIDFPKGMWRSLREFNPNIIIYDGYGIGFMSAIIFGLKKKLYKKNIKLVFWNSNTSLNSGPLESSSKKARILLSFFLRKIKINLMKSFDTFAAGGKSMFDYLIDLKVKQNDITLVPRATFSKDDIDQLNLNYINNQNQKIKFIFCGEISKRKGVDIILDAVAIKTSTFKNVDIQLYGNFKSSEEAYFREKLLQNPQVRYMGWLESNLLIPIIQKSDMLLIPSRREPFGRITIEGLSCGAYLLMGDSVGASNDLNKDFLGSVFYNNCPQELYEIMYESILDIKKIRLRKAERVDWVRNNWTHDVSADGLLEIIRRD